MANIVYTINTDEVVDKKSVNEIIDRLHKYYLAHSDALDVGINAEIEDIKKTYIL